MLHGDISAEMLPTVMFDVSLLHDKEDESANLLFCDEVKITLDTDVISFLESLSDKFNVVILQEDNADYNFGGLLSVKFVRVPSKEQFHKLLELYKPIVCFTNLTRKYGVNKYATGYRDKLDAWRRIFNTI